SFTIEHKDRRIRSTKQIDCSLTVCSYRSRQIPCRLTRRDRAKERNFVLTVRSLCQAICGDQNNEQTREKKFFHTCSPSLFFNGEFGRLSRPEKTGHSLAGQYWLSTVDVVAVDVAAA